MILQKVISGAQTGADQAGLVAAFACNIPTGGCMPKGCITQAGRQPDLAKLYKLYEHISSKYSPRTFENVRMSDGTMRFAFDFHSPGELCTLKAIKQYQKPYMDVDLNGFDYMHPQHAADWIVQNNIKTLNIAGNAEKVPPVVFEVVDKYLRQVFNQLKNND